MDQVKLLMLLALSGLLSATVVPLVRHLATAFDVVDRPDERRIHVKPTPRLGGVAIFFAFIGILSVAWLFGRKLPDAARVNPAGVWGFALGAIVAFGAGVIDDAWSLRPRTKLIFEVLAALITVTYGGCRVQLLSIPGGSWDLPSWLEAPVTVAWIVMVMNAVNLMDGLDGLAAGVTTIALGAIWMTAGTAHPSVAILCALLMGSCLGFLIYNFPPASIFMGDSGSLFLGFSLAVLATYSNAKASAGAVTLVPMLILALPLADTLFAMGRRYARGLIPSSLRSHVAGVARMFVADRLHFHHRLIRAGWNNRQAIAILWTIQVVACALALSSVISRGVRENPQAGNTGAMTSSAATVRER